MSEVISEEEFKTQTQKVLWDIISEIENACIEFKDKIEKNTDFLLRWEKLYNDLPEDAERKLDSLIYFHVKNVVVMNEPHI